MSEEKIDLKKYVGKKLYHFVPEIIVDDLKFVYREVEVLRANKKSLNVKNLVEYGLGWIGVVSQDDLPWFWETIEQGVKLNKDVFFKTIESHENEIQKYTPKHEKYQEFLDVIYILKEYQKILDENFCLDRIKEADKIIQNHMAERCKFKVSQVVITDRGKGTITHSRVHLRRVKPINEGLIEYGVTFPDKGFQTYSEETLKSWNP